MNPLTYDTIGLLWLTVDHLIAEFHERPEGGENDDALRADTPSPRELGPLPRVSAEIRRHPLERVKESPLPACDILVVSSTEREREAIGSSFAGSDTMSPLVLPRYWRGDSRLVIVHVEIPSGDDLRCAARTAAHFKRYRPRLAILAGVMAGARPGDQALGDVIAANKTIAVNMVKQRPVNDEFRKDAIKDLPAATDKWLREVIREWDAREFSSRAGINRIHIGPVLSGEQYKGDPDRLYPEAAQHEALGAEMEAAVFSRIADSLGTPWLAIKGVCDFASEDNYYQPLAAFRSAEFIQFLCRRPDIRQRFPTRR